MLKFLSKKPRPTLGLDITLSAINMVEISELKGQLHLESYGQAFFHPNTHDGSSSTDPDEVAQLIKKIYNTGHFQSKQVVLSVPDSAVLTKIMSIPKSLTDSEIEELIALEVAKIKPSSLHVYFDYELKGPSKHHTDMVDILIVLSPSAPIKQKIESIRRAGLEVQGVDVESYAVERMGSLICDGASSGKDAHTIAVLDIGWDVIRLFVFQTKGKGSVFTRIEKFGEMQLLQKYAQHHNLTMDDAIQKHLYDVHDNELKMSSIEYFIPKLMGQITRALKFYDSNCIGEVVQTVFLAGCMSTLSGLKDLIQSEVDRPTFIINPLPHFFISNKINKQSLTKVMPTLLIALGLGLKGL
ncbi:MAG: type IV pilus assembly protein PilM [Legionella sp.]|nr:type IV pilus assembly protein PilM [Legionella sp.]